MTWRCRKPRPIQSSVTSITSPSLSGCHQRIFAKTVTTGSAPTMPMASLRPLKSPMFSGSTPPATAPVPARGRLQALSVAWDARPKAEGGQRWYHIYENTDEDVSHSSPLHWTGIYHNWNSRCAECHSTDVHKNYNLSTDSYDTQYQAIDVGCEACHGPGAQHIDLARRGALSASNNGLVVSLAGRGLWTREAQAPVASRTSGPTASVKSRAAVAVIPDAPPSVITSSENLGDTHRISSVQAPLYWHDGQIRDEVMSTAPSCRARWRLREWFAVIAMSLIATP